MQHPIEAPGYHELKAENEQLQFDLAMHVRACTGHYEEINRQAEEIERLQAIIRCEQTSGQCVMIHDPEREPCTMRNCHFMGVRNHEHRGSDDDVAP